MAKTVCKFPILAVLAASCLGSHVEAVNLVDPGFESPVVAAGGFTHTGDPAWTFTNDAGVTRPFTNPTSTGVLNTWSATFAPVEGSQYASTYAGGDTIRQTVSLTPGSYILSVYAAAPSGSVVIPPNTNGFPLVTGAFEFTFGGQNSVAMAMPPGTNWQPFAATFNFNAAGNVSVGIRNTVTASYFINYDAFSLTRVPEGSSFALFMVGIHSLLFCRRHRRLCIAGL